jgi:hypothetical protein
MKKFILCLMLMVSAFLVFSACGNKTAATPQEFQSAMEQLGYQVVDISDQYEDGYTAYLAINADSTYQIEFYQLPSVDLAAQAYSVNRDDFESLTGDSSTYVETSGTNSAKYALTSNDTYYYVSYINDTLVYVTASDSYKDEINAAIDTIGY